MENIIYTSNDMDLILSDIQSYIEQTSDENERIQYTNELNETKNNWNKLIETGVFHDAIGKVVNKKSNEVEVAIEY
jgi:hypothetical protein